MVCGKVIGNHNGITMVGSHGHFESMCSNFNNSYIVQSIDLSLICKLFY